MNRTGHLLGVSVSLPRFLCMTQHGFATNAGGSALVSLDNARSSRYRLLGCVMRPSGSPSGTAGHYTAVVEHAGTLFAVDDDRVSVVQAIDTKLVTMALYQLHDSAALQGEQLQRQQQSTSHMYPVSAPAWATLEKA
jgi:ubiquitin C-terminal hydrolase